jgi:uncharacterized protein (TIGR02246 family)
MQSSKRLKSKSNAANAFPLRSKCHSPSRASVLNFAAEEAERLGQRHVGTEHLLLGLLREENALAAVTLRRHGAHLAEIRLKLAGNASRSREPTTPAGTHYSYRLASKPARSAMDAVSSFLSGLKSKTSPDLADFFADNGQFIDASGKIWFGREEIKKEFERLFAAFSKKNTSYRIEKTISERQAAVLVSVLWENAVHTEQTPRSVIRMTILLVPEDEEWAIFLMLIAPVAGSLA